MDRELLRVVIIATGLLVIIAMLGWHFFKNRKLAGDGDLFGNLPLFNRPGRPEEPADDGQLDAHPRPGKRYPATEEKAVADPMFDSFNELPELFAADDDGDRTGDLDHGLDDDGAPPRFTVPDIIQFRLMAKHPAGFSGPDLLQAFQIAHLQYGSLKIYERLDAANRLVDFGVACLAGDGTFPDVGMESFTCPGLVFFMQPSMLDDPVAVFDDFIYTLRLLAEELDGEARDHLGQPLTEATVAKFRRGL